MYQISISTALSAYFYLMVKKLIEIGLNIIFWIVSAWLIVSSFSIQSQEIEIINGVENLKIYRNDGAINLLILCIGFSCTIFYVNYLLLINYINTVGRSILLMAAFSILIPIIFYIVFLLFSPLISSLQLPSELIFGIMFFYYAISIGYALCKLYIKAELKHRTLLFEKKNVELNLLRLQLQPHFLFNALNNLLSMVNQDQNPDLAKALDKLSSLLRYVVYDTENTKVSIEKEIEFIKNYCELQMLRFEKDEVKIKFKISGNHKIMIEPGLFLPFVENAFKYGVEPEKTSCIDINFNLENKGELNFSIKNPFFKVMQAQKGNGTGIINTKERLKLVYQNKYRLDIKNDEEEFAVNLKLFVDENHNY